eukprot:GHVU01133297.1.p1 GENE.GHVU01133297.1~~GHVU01133297.1.p1  ORF type:complete len:149 (+),score=49.99 GHVU01133297.1:660-1106(+)
MPQGLVELDSTIDAVETATNQLPVNRSGLSFFGFISAAVAAAASLATKEERAPPPEDEDAADVDAEGLADGMDASAAASQFRGLLRTVCILLASGGQAALEMQQQQQQADRPNESDEENPEGQDNGEDGEAEQKEEGDGQETETKNTA